jgi:hypothetical protein
VKLKDGSVFRGTILEYVSGDHVDLLLPSGQTHRFPMSEVTYQGPVSGASEEASDSASDSDLDDTPARSTRAAPRANSNAVDVHVSSDQDDVALLFRTGQSDFDAYGAGYRTFVAVSGSARNCALVCNTPCDTQLPKGVHRMALSLGGGRAVEADKPVHVEDPSTLRVHYESRSGARAGRLGALRPLDGRRARARGHWPAALAGAHPAARSGADRDRPRQQRAPDEDPRPRQRGADGGTGVGARAQRSACASELAIASASSLSPAAPVGLVVISLKVGTRALSGGAS